jgi:PilZ domain
VVPRVWPTEHFGNAETLWVSFMTENPERRYSQRNRPKQLIYVDLEPDNGGMMRNVSEEGFSFRAVNPVRPNGNIRFAFAIDQTRRLEGMGELEWAEEDGKLGGLRFTDVSEEFRREIRRWLTKSQPSVGAGKAFMSAAAVLDTREQSRTDLKAEPSKAQPAPPLVESRMARPAVSSVGKLEIEKETAPSAGLPTKDLLRAEALVVLDQLKAETVEESAVGRALPIGAERREEPAAQLNAVERRGSKELATAEEVREGSLPWLSRAAAVGIVATGMAVVLSAAVFSFRREVGKALIRLGEKMVAETQPLILQRRVALETPPVTPAMNLSANSPSGSPATGARVNPVPGELSPIRKAPSTPVGSSKVTAPRTALEEPGQAEFAEAQRILGRKKGSRDITRAMKLLWVAVQKGNSAAGLTLSDLYLRGQVVAKNCAQVRVLLTTAAKKGSAEAKTRLEQLSGEGCP